MVSFLAILHGYECGTCFGVTRTLQVSQEMSLHYLRRLFHKIFFFNFLRISMMTSYWWFVYDVIRNTIMQNYDQFVPNFDMTYKTIKRVPVPNLRSFGATKTELGAKEVGELSIGKWAGGHSLAHQHGCRNINVWRLSKL